MQKKQPANDHSPILSVKDIKLEWKEEVRSISELKDNPKNPRHINDDGFDRLVNLLKKNGYHQRILIDLHNMILGGHQRKKALLQAGWDLKSLINVLVPNRELTQEEMNSISISDNTNMGSFDMDILANEYEVLDLIEWGIHPCVFDAFKPKEEKSPKEPKQQTCPECGHQWL